MFKSWHRKCFNAFVAKENQKLNADGSLSLVDDETDVAFELGNPNESYFRKMSYETASGTLQRYYVAAENKIFIQELKSSDLSQADKRFLTTFENSVRNEYDTRAFVSK